jgi:hypothetical protein
MDRFAVTLRLASLLVTGGGYMTLDALLAESAKSTLQIVGRDSML